MVMLGHVGKEFYEIAEHSEDIEEWIGVALLTVKLGLGGVGLTAKMAFRCSIF